MRDEKGGVSMSLYYKAMNNNVIEITEEKQNVDYFPRDDFNLGTFITFERFESPEPNPFNSWNDMLEFFDSNYTGNMKNDLNNLKENALKKGYVLVPVFKNHHHLDVYQADYQNPFPSRFESELCGLIYASKEKIKEYYDVKRI